MIEIIQAIVSFAFIVAFAALAVALFKLRTLNTQLFHISQQLSSDNKVLALEINKVTATEAYEWPRRGLLSLSLSQETGPLSILKMYSLLLKHLKTRLSQLPLSTRGIVRLE